MTVDLSPRIKLVKSLFPMQSNLLFSYLYEKNSNAYFEQIAFNFKGDLNVDLLEKSMNLIINKHDAFKTLFLYEEVSEPLQVILETRESNIKFQNLANLTKEQQLEYIESFKNQDKKEGFDLSQDPLIRLSVFRLGNLSYKLILSYHHIIMDGWCLNIVLQDLFQTYQLLVDNKPLGLNKSYQYSDYINWIENQDKEEGLAYWSDYLQGYNQNTVISPNKLIHEEDEEHHEVTFELNKDLTEQLKKMAADYQVTVNTLVQTIWGILLQRYNQSQDVVFGAVTSGRPSQVKNIEDMVGLFINTIPVRIQSLEYNTFIELVQKVQSSALESEKYSYLSLADIQMETKVKQGLINHIVAFQNYPIKKPVNDHQLAFELSDIETFEKTNYDFNLLFALGERLTIQIKYNNHVYNQTFISRLKDHLKTIIQTVVLNPSIRLDEIELVTKEEKKELLDRFNNTNTAYESQACVHHLFEDQVTKTPHAVAVVCEGETLTYETLNQRATQLAQALRTKGIGPGKIVGLMMKRSLDMFVGIVGVLKAGGAYLSLDPSYPDERLQFIIEDSGLDLVVVHDQVSYETFTAPAIMNITSPNNYTIERSLAVGTPTATDLAYIIYTSGSTGQPKGVMVEHRSLVNLVEWHQKEFQITSRDRSTQFASVGFDASVWEIFPYLLAGSTIHIISDELRIDMTNLQHYYEEHGITCSFLP
ncbi:condensation domain-containing protein, partial [Priestia megaterium]|uniref:condensation domain-containing protein n=3 Tax=Priestia megaterium TaxID=1404 RepID=UPI00364270FB